MGHQLVDLTDRTIAEAKKTLRADLLRCVAAVSSEAAAEARTRRLTLLDVVTLATRYGAVPLADVPEHEPT